MLWRHWCHAPLFVILQLSSLDQSFCASDRYAPASYVQQRQDHFDKSNENTWRQAYYVNDTFWTPGSEAPIFLCVGGEGPALDSTAVTGSVHCNIAVEWLPQKKALMFALEHRYYGCHNMSACPVSDLTQPGALRFLSSRQAVKDVAHFVNAMKVQYGFSSRNKWITWGGSYPGMLAGWSRLKHPEIIHASVASSAPVAAKLDMPQYLDHVSVAYTVADNGVGGSTACRDAIRAGHKWIEDQFTAGETGITAVERKFSLSGGSLNTLTARINFAAMGVADFPAQSNDPLCEAAACNIAKVCAIMTDTSKGTEVERLVALRAAQGRSSVVDMRRIHNSMSLFSSRRVASTATSLDLPDFWFYQTCHEFGFYQTCEIGSECMFVRGIMNLSFFTDDCLNRYNVSVEDVQRNIDATNAHYGSTQPSGPDGSVGSCVLWPNGEVDPWSTLSVLQAPSDKQPTLWVPGASHHSWTWPSRPSDQASVVAARASIRQQVDDFLGKECKEAGQPDGDPSHGLQLPWIIGGSLLVLFVIVIALVFVRQRRARAVPLLSSSGGFGVSLEGRA